MKIIFHALATVAIALMACRAVNEGDWLAIVADNTTATFYRCNTNGFGTSLSKGLSHHENTANLPATATPLSGTLWSFLLVGVA